jgi:hypothetical protein
MQNQNDHNRGRRLSPDEALWRFERKPQPEPRFIRNNKGSWCFRSDIGDFMGRTLEGSGQGDYDALDLAVEAMGEFNINAVKCRYPNGKCDCGQEIPNDAVDGNTCSACGAILETLGEDVPAKLIELAYEVLERFNSATATF